MEISRSHAIATLFAAISVYFFVYSFQYDIGSASRMGPAYFPIMSSVALFAISIAIWFFDTDNKSAAVNCKQPGVFIPIVAILTFALTLETLGYAITTMCVTLLTLLTRENRNVKATVATGVLLVLFGYVVFVKLLGVYLPMWPRF